MSSTYCTARSARPLLALSPKALHSGTICITTSEGLPSPSRPALLRASVTIAQMARLLVVLVHDLGNARLFEEVGESADACIFRAFDIANCCEDGPGRVESTNQDGHKIFIRLPDEGVIRNKYR